MQSYVFTSDFSICISQGKWTGMDISWFDTTQIHSVYFIKKPVSKELAKKCLEISDDLPVNIQRTGPNIYPRALAKFFIKETECTTSQEVQTILGGYNVWS